MKDLHRLLLETQVVEGKLVCGNCGHAYVIKEGIANFLLPSHLGRLGRPGPFIFWCADWSWQFEIYPRQSETVVPLIDFYPNLRLFGTPRGEPANDTLPIQRRQEILGFILYMRGYKALENHGLQ